MARELRVEILGDSRDLERAFGRASKSSSGFGRSIAGVGKVAGLAALGGIAAIGFGLKKSVDAAKEAEVSQKRMEAQLKALGLSYEKQAGHIDTVIQKQSRLAALDDEEVQDAFTGLVRTTKDVNKALELNALAADLARGKNIDLQTASTIVGKVFSGNVGALGRYGIAIEKGTSATEALGILQERFAGQAKAFGESAAGGSERFSIALENLQETAGTVLLPVLAKLTSGAAEFLTKLSESETVKEVMRTIGDVISTTAQGVGVAFSAISKFAEENWPKVQAAAQSVATWYRDSLKPAIDNVITAIKAIWERFGEDILRIARTAFNTVRTVVKNGLENIKAAIDLALALIRGDWSEAWTALKTIVSNTLESLLAIVRGAAAIFLTAAKALGKAILDGIIAGLEALGSKLKAELVAVKTAIGSVAESALTWAAGIGRAIISGILSGLGGLLDAVKNSIENSLRGALDAVNPFSPIEVGAARLIGEPIVRGTLAGIAGMEEKLGRALASSVRGAVKSIPAQSLAFASAAGATGMASSATPAGGGHVHIHIHGNLIGTDARAARELGRLVEPYLNRGPASIRTL